MNYFHYRMMTAWRLINKVLYAMEKYTGKRTMYHLDRM